MRLTMLLVVLLNMAPLHAEVVRIAAAANFKPTATQITALFETRSGYKTILSSASTGMLYSQINHGAPFDIFFAADANAPKMLDEHNLIVPGQRFCYARGILALVGGNTPEKSLAAPRLSLAIANPKTAPYGVAAMDVLQRPEFQGASGRKLIRANNAIQAYQHWHSRAVDLALVPLSLALDEGTVIDPSWYTPLEQQLVLLKRGEDNPAAQAYIRWVKTDEVQAIIKDAGYGNCQ